MQLQMLLPQVEAYHIANQFENMPHAHDGRYQVTIPTRGTCYFVHENKPVKLTAGDMLLLHPSDRHHFHIGDDAAVMIAIAGSESIASGLSVYRDEAAIRKSADPQAAAQLFRRWMGLAFQETEPLAASEAEQLILADLRELLQGRSGPALQAKGGELRVPRDPHIARAAEYIREHYAEPLKIEELAAVALQSRYHFIRSFKAEIGLTPYQFVLYLRMEEAKRLLRHTACTVTEISCRLGFEAPSQFYRAFEKRVRATPEQYRSGAGTGGRER